jgi:23S rRNA pseudouridine2605 synthase
MERLQKIIAQAGVASRRKAEELILAGRVTVDGVVIDTLGFKAKKGSEVCVDGKKLDGEDKVYYVMYKPKKVICTLNDEHDRNTVVNLMKDVPQRIFPVGRLDYDTTGVLILTNDGDFANAMTHPRYHLAKTYEVHIDGVLTTPQIKNLEHGIQLDDGTLTLPAKVWITHKDFGRKTTDFDLTIKEGKNHQVKRMVEALGYEVTRLHRKSFAFIKVNDMVPGQYRRLKPFEVKQLRKLAEEGEME